MHLLVFIKSDFVPVLITASINLQFHRMRAYNIDTNFSVQLIDGSPYEHRSSPLSNVTRNIQIEATLSTS